MKYFLKSIAILVTYIGAITLIFIIKTYNKNLVKLTVGKVGLYGTRKMVDEYVAAIKYELTKYDPELAKAIFEGNIQFDIIYQDTLRENINDIPEARTFFPPLWINDSGVEGMCQHVAYCALVTKGTHSGLAAAINLIDRNRRLSLCKQEMRKWIIAKNFPKKWLSIYGESEPSSGGQDSEEKQ